MSYLRQLACVFAVAVFSSARAVIINVGPGDSIQDAINAAMDGDEIVVAPGTYFETIDFLGKPITLRSSDGPEVTTIDATGLEEVSVVTCESGEGSNTVLEGFTITGGTGTCFETAPGRFLVLGGGMFNTNSSSPTVTNCTFCDNSPEHIGGQVVLSGQIHMSSFCPIPVCPGDITGDGIVGITDFLDLLAAWGACQ